MSSRQQLAFFAEPLSKREREVVIMVGQDMSNKDIAAKLWISDETVKSHMRHILQKSGARTRTGAVVSALRTGEVSMSDLSPSFPTE
jgi:DNA-binding CsgD family transcriptional regulator